METQANKSNTHTHTKKSALMQKLCSFSILLLTEDIHYGFEVQTDFTTI